jgi:glycosyltransferase involved in cell wall biosynthesis
MPRVSVNIPCYNSVRFIEGTIRAVLGQTFEDFELLVLDDGSTDGTAALVESFGDARLRLERQSNQGLGAARNRLLEISTGDLIAFCDHDDVWDRDKLRLQVETLDQSPEVALVYTDAWQVYENGHRVRFSRFHRPHSGSVLRELLADFFIVLSTAVIRRQVAVDMGGFPPNYQVAEEMVLFLRLAERFPIAYIDQPMIEYRLHSSNSSRRLGAFVREMEEIMGQWSQRDDLELKPICARCLARTYYLAGRQGLLRLEDPKLARRYLRLGFRHGCVAPSAAFWTASWLPRPLIRMIRRVALSSLG